MGLADVATGGLRDDSQLTNFPGPTCRRPRPAPERRRSCGEAYSFMIRLRLPAACDVEAVAGARPSPAPTPITLRADDAPDVPVPRRHQVEHAAHHAGNQRRPVDTLAASGREPQRDGGRQSYCRRRTLPRTNSREGQRAPLPQTGAYTRSGSTETRGRQEARRKRKRSRSTARTICAQIQDRIAVRPPMTHISARPRLITTSIRPGHGYT